MAIAMHHAALDPVALRLQLPAQLQDAGAVLGDSQSEDASSPNAHVGSAGSRTFAASLDCRGWEAFPNSSGNAPHKRSDACLGGLQSSARLVPFPPSSWAVSTASKRWRPCDSSTKMPASAPQSGQVTIVSASAFLFSVIRFPPYPCHKGQAHPGPVAAAAGGTTSESRSG